MPDHLSFSQLTSLARCGKAYELSRIAKAPTVPSMWLFAGNALHNAFEAIAHDHPNRSIDLFATWQQAWDKTVEEYHHKTSVPMDEWRVGGRVSKDKPNREDAAWWKAEGFLQVQMFDKWLYTSGYQILDINGTKAIEVETTMKFGDILVRGFADLMAVTPDGEVEVIDYKSGTKTPLSAMQLGLYATWLQDSLDVPVRKGRFFMTRKGELTEQFDLTRWDQRYFEAQFLKANTAITQRLFIANPGDNCRSCDVRDACYAMQGGDAWLYDSDHPQYTPTSKEN